MSKLPAINKLYDNKDLSIADKNKELEKLLDNPPSEKWIKTHNNVSYLPISRVEWLLTVIFTKWKVETKKVQLIANSVVVEVRLHVMDPMTNEWDWQDGVGGAPIQTAKGAGATDFTQMSTYGVQKCAPAAESFAIKDAAEKFGKLFGKDINRNENIFLPEIQPEINLEECTNKLMACGTLEDLNATYMAMTREEKNNPDVIKLKDELKQTLGKGE